MEPLKTDHPEIVQNLTSIQRRVLSLPKAGTSNFKYPDPGGKWFGAFNGTLASAGDSSNRATVARTEKTRRLKPNVLRIRVRITGAPGGATLRIALTMAGDNGKCFAHLTCFPWASRIRVHRFLAPSNLISYPAIQWYSCRRRSFLPMRGEVPARSHCFCQKCGKHRTHTASQGYTGLINKGASQVVPGLFNQEHRRSLR